jgi:hypothetical protein
MQGDGSPLGFLLHVLALHGDGVDDFAMLLDVADPEAQQLRYPEAGAVAHDKQGLVALPECAPK